MAEKTTIRTPSERAASPPAPSAAARGCIAFFSGVFGPPEAWDFTLRLWDGTKRGPRPHRSRFTLVLQRPSAIRRLLPPTRRRLGEAYVFDDVDVEGSLEEAFATAETLARALRSPAGLVRLLPALWARSPGVGRRSEGPGAPPRHGPLHSRRRDASAVRFHYDVGNDFYRLWLDRGLVYSCAYFAEPEWELDRAQEAKLDLVCRKLELEPGHRLLDIGCGWGSLILHAAARYGVRAVGITLSANQAELARRRIHEAGLDDLCEVRVADYRELPDERFDRIASVGMVEHVGRRALPRYFAEAFRLLEPGGLFMNHGIVSLRAPSGWLRRQLGRIRRRTTSFIDRYVFPDSELMLPTQVLAPAEREGFEIRDVQSLREHYALTLRHWVRRLEARAADAIALVGEPTFRVWRLYMSASARLFATARLGVVQTLLARPASDGLVRISPDRRHHVPDA